MKALQKLRDYVKKRGGTFSPDFEKWLKNTKNNREVFAMFFPPDPSVATNVAFMIDELGLETTEKYDQLVLAFAVGPVSYTHLYQSPTATICGCRAS